MATLQEATGEIDTESLANNEQSVLDMAFQRSLEDTRALDTETIVEKFREYRNEIEFAASVAKAQMDQQIGGQITTPNKVAVTKIEPEYFGYDDWDNVPDASADTTSIWLDSDVPDNVTGSGGEPAIVGDEAVHLILGMGTYSENEHARSFLYQLDRNLKTAVKAEDAFRNTDLMIQWMDQPFLLYEDREVYGEFYSAFAGDTAFRPVGVSFIDGKKARNVDPDTFTGTQVAGNVLVEQ